MTYVTFAPRISIEEGRLRHLLHSARQELYYDVTPVDFGILMGLPPTEVMAAMVGLFCVEIGDECSQNLSRSKFKYVAMYALVLRAC